MAALLYRDALRDHALIITVLNGIRFCGPIDDDISTIFLFNLALVIPLIIVLFRRLHTEVQLTILEEEELAEAVGTTHHELVEALIILHQIGNAQLISARRLGR